jgi:YVTN family beta-propeller protein
MLLATPLAAATIGIYVNNNAGTTVSVIDPATNKVVQVIGGVEVPEAIGSSLDGSRLFITSGSDDVLAVVDRKTGKHIKKVPLSGNPNDLAVTKDGKRVLVCIHSAPPGLDVIDTTSLEKIKTIPTKALLHDIVVTGDGKYAVGGSRSGVVVFDLKSDQIAWEIPFEHSVAPMAIESAPDGTARRLFVQLQEVVGFVIVDFAKRQEVTRMMLPDQSTAFGRAHSHGMGVAPDGKTLWVASTGSNSVFSYSLPELKLLGRVYLPSLKLPGNAVMGAGPEWITFTPDSKTVYVSNGALRSVSAIDVRTLKEVTRIPVGEVPDRIATLVTP